MGAIVTVLARQTVCRTGHHKTCVFIRFREQVRTAERRWNAPYLREILLSFSPLSHVITGALA